MQTPAAPPPENPLRLAIVTSSGAYDQRTQAPFAEDSLIGDLTHRVFPADLPAERIAFAHAHYDRSAARSDAETVLPRATLRAAGVSLVPHVISWSGYCLDWPGFIEQTVPQILAQLRADGANAALVVPV